MRTETWTDGKLREQWNDLTRTYTSWDADGEIVEVRAYTAAENSAADARAAAANAQAATAADLTSKMQNALTNNLAYLNLASPSAAQSQAQIKALTRQMNAAIRYITGALDSTDGT